MQNSHPQLIRNITKNSQLIVWQRDKSSANRAYHDEANLICQRTHLLISQTVWQPITIFLLIIGCFF